MRRQPRALGSQRILHHLHQQLVALAHQRADIRAIGRGVVMRVVAGIRRRREDVRHMQECRAGQADLQKRRLHARQHARHPALVEIAHQPAPAGAFDEHLLQGAVFEQRGAGFARRDVDQNLDAHRLLPARPQCLQQLRGLVQGQAHHTGVAAADVFDEQRTAPLDGVAAGLALRFAGFPVCGSLRRRDVPHGYIGATQRLDHAGRRWHQRHGRHHLVGASGQRGQHAQAIGPIHAACRRPLSSTTTTVSEPSTGRVPPSRRSPSSALAQRQPLRQLLRGVSPGSGRFVDIHGAAPHAARRAAAAVRGGAARPRQARWAGSRRHSFAVIGMAVEQRHRAVHLFGPHHAHQRMRQRQRRQRPALVGARQHLRREAIGAADQEPQVLRRPACARRAIATGRGWCAPCRARPGPPGSRPAALQPAACALLQPWRAPRRRCRVAPRESRPD